MLPNKNSTNTTTNTNTNTNENEDSFVKVSLVNQSVFIRKKKSCPLRDIDISEIDYKNLKLLNKFISERGKIVPSRISNVEIKKQRAIANAVKKARFLALISPIKKD
ncbi:MAG: 30S ribosomal protein S18 [Proteobacteria bacterium]|jgi:small subunit ribosomal protein S18|nr:30S ribosomal protein S18 [Pseudomonadota bacterium]NCA28389.1 30S ribosomal protein S18 [Pseudomonadota bacterium]